MQEPQPHLVGPVGSLDWIDMADELCTVVVDRVAALYTHVKPYYVTGVWCVTTEESLRSRRGFPASATVNSIFLTARCVDQKGLPLTTSAVT